VSQVTDNKAKLTVALDGHGRNGGHRTGGGRRRTVAEVLGSRGQSEREGERAGQRAQMEEGKWESRARGSKEARGLGRGRRTRGRGHVHDGEIVGGRLRTADRWGRRDRERERAGAAENNGADRVGPRDRERGGAQCCADWGDPPVRQRGRPRTGLSGLPWAKFYFPFSKEFLIAFLFIFSRVFNSNSNQVSNSNQIKYVQQFKKYLGSI
jgi:hypothetical protein